MYNKLLTLLQLVIYKNAASNNTSTEIYLTKTNMKKFFLLLFFAVTAQLIYAQRNDTILTGTASPQALHDFYKKKSRTNKTVAWIMLSSGVVMFIGGSLINFDENFLNSQGDQSKGAWLAYLGIGSTLGSIPFFIAGRKNKLKARLALKGEAVTIGNKMLPKSAYTAFALTIPL